jgi:hypothetical protein
MTSDGFEAGVGNWFPFSCNFTQDNTHVHVGDWAAKMVVTGSPGSAGVRPAAQPAVAGQPYIFTMWSFAVSSTTNVQATIGWQNAGGGSTGSDSTKTVTLPAGTWTSISVTGVAPSGTTQAAYGPTLVSSPTTGKTIWVDDTSFLLIGPAITAAQDSGWPPRITLEATGLTVGQLLTIYRSQNSIRTPVRGADGVTLTDTGLVVHDGEMSYGLPVTYIVNLNGVDVATSNTLTPSLPGGNVALSDAISGKAAEVVITAWPDKTTDRESTQFVVGGRIVVVSAPRGGFTSDIEFMTDTEDGRLDMIDLLANATSGIIMLRSADAASYPGVDSHLFVVSDTESRAAQSGKLERRLWTLSVVESDPWAASLQTGASTYADLKNAYIGHTYADLKGDFLTYLDVAAFDWEGGL